MKIVVSVVHYLTYICLRIFALSNGGSQKKLRTTVGSQWIFRKHSTFSLGESTQCGRAKYSLNRDLLEFIQFLKFIPPASDFIFVLLRSLNRTATKPIFLSTTNLHLLLSTYSQEALPFLKSKPLVFQFDGYYYI